MVTHSWQTLQLIELPMGWSTIFSREFCPHLIGALAVFQPHEKVVNFDNHKFERGVFKPDAIAKVGCSSECHQEYE
jgi:hypothetical protein